jgi:hypothetical protein
MVEFLPLFFSQNLDPHISQLGNPKVASNKIIDPISTKIMYFNVVLQKTNNLIASDLKKIRGLVVVNYCRQII